MLLDFNRFLFLFIYLFIWGESLLFFFYPACQSLARFSLDSEMLNEFHSRALIFSLILGRCGWWRGCYWALFFVLACCIFHLPNDSALSDLCYLQGGGLDVADTRWLFLQIWEKWLSYLHWFRSLWGFAWMVLNVRVNILTRTHTHIHRHTHRHIRVHEHSYMHLYIYIYIYICIHTHTNVHPVNCDLQVDILK